MHEHDLPAIGLDTSAAPIPKEIEVPADHTYAYFRGEVIDDHVGSVYDKDIEVSKGASSCYYTLAFQGEKLVFKHLVLATALSNNKFARNFFNKLFPDPSRPESTKIVMIGSHTTQSTASRPNDRDYHSNAQMKDILNVNDEFAQVFKTEGPERDQPMPELRKWPYKLIDLLTASINRRQKKKFPYHYRDQIPENVSLNILPVQTTTDWETLAITFGNGTVVIWDEKTHKPIQKFTYQELQNL